MVIKVLIDLNKLNNDNIVTLDSSFLIDLNVYSNKDISALENLYVQGSIKYNASDNLDFNLNITGIMYLKDTITLEIIEYPLNINITEEYSLNSPELQDYYKKEQNTLDIIGILWENIVLEVPMRFTKSKNVTLKGDGWSMGDNKIKDDIDPRLAKLTELLREGKE